MNLEEQTRRITDKLSYNLLYAPDYPEEDRTSIEREEAVIHEWTTDLLKRPLREDVGDWYRLGETSIKSAFDSLRFGRNSVADKEFQAAITYFRNALSKKVHKPDFFIGPDGAVQEE